MKIALCLFGQVRDLEQGYAEYRDKLFSRYDVDVFAHLWKDDKISKFYELYNPTSAKVETQIQFNTTKYGKAYGLEPWHSTAYERTFNSISQFYSFKQVCKLRQEYESGHGIKYDISIKGRLDNWITNFDIDLLSVEADKYYVPSMPQGFMYNDTLAVGSSDVMDIVGNRYNRLEEWYNSQDYNFIPEYVTDKVLREKHIEIVKHPSIVCDLYRIKN